jgi:amino acid transporter
MIGRDEGYLPPVLQKLNKQGIQENILIAQGIVTSIIALLYAFIPNVSSAYWIFSVMTTQVYLIVYLLMFVAAVKLRRDQPDHERGYRAPALTVLCVVGFLSAAAAMIIGFVPPSQFGGGDAFTYALLIGGGLFLFGLLVPILILWLRKPSWKQPENVRAIG